MKPQFDINFIDGPYIEYKSGDDDKLRVDFIDQGTGIIKYSDIIHIGESIKIDTIYFIDWILKFYTNESLVLEKKFNCRGKRVYIAIESNALGDNLAWMPYIDTFRKKHQCKVIASTFYNDLFKDQYKHIEFVEPGVTVCDLYAMYRIGLFYSNNEVDVKYHSTDFKKISLQQAASDILGVAATELKPKLKLNKKIKK
ncbi:MAG: autotransporter strand-loop-strand O-heptosyltransferase [Candidatus Paceibacteria bacterium]|jgi:autotransporter strand-loop-strand O-heptosyltransferase